MIRRLTTMIADNLHQARYGMLAALMVYAAGAVAGWWFADALDVLQPAAEGLAGAFRDKGPVDFIASLFLHNLAATYITMCLVTLWGLVPLAAAVGNGLLLGWVVATVTGTSLSTAAALLVPHGLFEWPAMLIAWGVGLWRGVGYRFGPHSARYIDRWKQANLLYFSIVLPLLLIAAVIEGRGRILAIVSG